MFICVSFWQSFFISTTYFLFEQDYLKRYNQIGMGIWISRCIITPWSLLYSFFFQLFSSSILKVFVLLFGWLSSLLSNVWSVLTCKRILRRVANTDFLGIQNLFAYSCYDVTFATTWHLRPFLRGRRGGCKTQVLLYICNHEKSRPLLLPDGDIYLLFNHTRHLGLCPHLSILRNHHFCYCLLNANVVFLEDSLNNIYCMLLDETIKMIWSFNSSAKNMQSNPLIYFVCRSNILLTLIVTLWFGTDILWLNTYPLSIFFTLSYVLLSDILFLSGRFNPVLKNLASLMDREYSQKLNHWWYVICQIMDHTPVRKAVLNGLVIKRRSYLVKQNEMS